MQTLDGNEKYIINTLIDITNSGIITPKNDPLGFHQEQNLNTFLQILGLRTQIMSYSVSIKQRAKLENYNFGEGFNKTSTVWTLTFIPEATLSWKKEDDPTFWLYQDFNNIPIHCGLSEKAKINPEIVDSLGVNKNTCFEYIVSA